MKNKLLIAAMLLFAAQMLYAQAKKDSSMAEKKIEWLKRNPSLAWMASPPIYDATYLGVSKIDTSTKGYGPEGRFPEQFGLRIRRVTAKFDESKPPALGYYIYLYKEFDGKTYCFPTTLVTDTIFNEVNYWMKNDSVVNLQFYCGNCKKDRILLYTLRLPLRKEDSIRLAEWHEGDMEK